LDYSQADYLQWIKEQKVTKEKYKFDIALICRLLNNLSTFELNFSNNWRMIHKLGEEGLSKADWLNRRFEPHNCLSPDNLSTKYIFLKNSNVLLKIGESFRHLSLSNYYKGLQLLHNKDALNDSDTNSIYFPIRQFNPSCLQLSEGNSILGELCNLAKLVVIEDVDLTKKMNPEQERTPIDRPCGLYQEYVQGQIKKTLLSEEILVNVLVDWYGQVTFL
ncbi:unnamed protein product, partial [marine sediment metagenome]